MIRLRGFFYAILAIILLGFCGATVLTLIELRRDTWVQATTGARNLLTVLSGEIERNIRSYDGVLRRVAVELGDPALAQISPTLQQSLLFEDAFGDKYLAAILAFDRDGNALRQGGSLSVSPLDVRSQAYFQAHATNPEAGLFLSNPFQNSATGNDGMIALSRGIKGPDGAFAGIVVAMVRTDLFHDLFARADLHPDDSINLLSSRGILLMRNPYQGNQIGRDLSASENFKRFQTEGAGTLSGVAAIDGQRRIYCFAHVADLPLILNVGLSEKAIFAPWNQRAALIGCVLLLLCALTLTLGWVVRREFTRRARAEAVMRSSEAQYRLLADHATDVILRLDRALVRRYVSPACRQVLGYEPDELLGKAVRDIVHPEDWPQIERMTRDAQETLGNAEATYRLRHKAGHYVWIEGRYSYVAEDGGFIVVLRDISKRKAAELQLASVNAELETLANTDSLTRIANRRRFDEALLAERRKAETGEAPLSLLLIDVDRFKLYNDRYGHQAGDECLRRVAAAIAGSIRQPKDLVARYGGEEIAVLLPRTGEGDALAVAERIRRAVEALGIPHEENAPGLVATISIGCATEMGAASEERPGAHLVAEADRMLYEAKRSGRNRVVSSAGAHSAAFPAAPDEERRLQAVETFQEIAANTSHEKLDRIAKTAAQLLDMPIGFISLVGEDELRLIGRHGLDVERVPRDIAFCSHAIMGVEPLVIADTATDPRVQASPLVQGDKGLRFYAGAPLIDPASGQAVGAVCVADHKPHETLDPAKRGIIKDLSKLVASEFTSETEEERAEVVR